MPALNVRVDQDLWSALEAQKPHFLSSTAYLNLIIHQAIDGGFTLGARPAGAGSLSSVVNKEEEERARAELINRPPTTAEKKPAGDPFAKKTISIELVPDDLLDDGALLVDFWKVKKGTRSERAWNGLINKLRAMSAADRTKALTAAYDGGWATVYEPKPDAPAQGKWAPPETPHPASRVFTAADFFEDEPTNPVLKDLV